jgi:acetoin utilization deacetylase AcuC-like enzyme
MSSSLLSSVDALHTKTVHDWRVVQKKLEPLSAKLDAHRRALIASIETGTQVVEAFDALLGVVESSANAIINSVTTLATGVVQRRRRRAAHCTGPIHEASRNSSSATDRDIV